MYSMVCCARNVRVSPRLGATRFWCNASSVDVTDRVDGSL